MRLPRHLPVGLLLALSCTTPATLSAQARFDWAALAAQDIEAVHAALRDNHPGPVDPENSRFREWLATGRAAALARASSARSAADYQRALRFYANGFRDGHIQLNFNALGQAAWPGFLTHTGPDGRTTVAARADDAAPPLGAELLACDGTPAAALVQRLVAPYRTNADIPHEAAARSVYLFVTVAEDPAAPARCTMRSGAATRTVTLRWRPFPAAIRARVLAEAEGVESPPLGVRTLGGVTFISMPSFDWWDDRAALFKAFLDTLRTRRSELLAAPHVVLDLRGNEGGNSSWGSQALSVLWGDAPVRAVEASFDWTVDWRASTLNVAKMRDAASNSRSAGLAEDAQFRDAIADSMEAALRDGRPYVRSAAPAQPLDPAALGASPFAHAVDILTDHACASACLDFMDIALRLPGTRHVGLATSADAIYIDNTALGMPSGLVSLSYSLKVYRHRVRGNNVWYTPAQLWTGGAMTDAAVAAWIAGVDRR